MSHLVAVHTYGAQQVTDPQTGARVSAQKIGYSGGTSAILRAILGDQVRDVTSKRASYHYLQINAQVHIRQGFILFRLSDDDLSRIEQIARQHAHSRAYRWREDRWYHLPTQRNADYALAVSGSPPFTPVGMSATPTDGQTIVIEKRQHDPNKTPWWWLSGDTYPHREFLRQQGARWSKKRRSWYLIAEKLPESVQNWADSLNQAPLEDKNPPQASAAEQPPHTDERYQTFAAEQDEHALAVFERTILHEGQWLTRRQFVERACENDLPARVGDEQPPHAKTFWIGARSVSQLEYNYLQHLKDAEPVIDEQKDDLPSQIRIISPTLSDDSDDDGALRDAIAQAKASPPPAHKRASQQTGVQRISQGYCGELTGSVTGQVYCYGWAIQDGVCVYLNLAGPRMAVEAMRARMSQGEIVNLMQWDGPSIELTAGEGETGKYSAFMQNIPEAKFTSLILVHERMVEPNYGGKSLTALFYLSDEQAMAQLRHHVTALVNVPVFEAWTPYLWRAGQAAQLVRKTRGSGLSVLGVDLDQTSWERLITGGLAEGVIQLPRDQLK